jgi:hypothetical protein
VARAVVAETQQVQSVCDPTLVSTVFTSRQLSRSTSENWKGWQILSTPGEYLVAIGTHVLGVVSTPTGGLVYEPYPSSAFDRAFPLLKVGDRPLADVEEAYHGWLGGLRIFHADWPLLITANHSQYASEVAMGACLSQKDESTGVRRPRSSIRDFEGILIRCT